LDICPGSFGSYILSFLKNLHTDFHSGCTNLHFHKQCIWAPSLPHLHSHPHQHLLLVFLMLAILTGVRHVLNAILICISFMVRNVEHFFMYLLPFVLLLLRIANSSISQNTLFNMQNVHSHKQIASCLGVRIPNFTMQSGSGHTVHYECTL
jgi:hypothetical protein